MGLRRAAMAALCLLASCTGVNPDYDPTRCDLDKINKALKKLGK